MASGPDIKNLPDHFISGFQHLNIGGKGVTRRDLFDNIAQGVVRGRRGYPFGGFRKGAGGCHGPRCGNIKRRHNCLPVHGTVAVPTG